MNKGVGDVTVRFKQILLPNITNMKIDKNTHYGKDAIKTKLKIWELLK